jgi:hypothetical protein
MRQFRIAGKIAVVAVLAGAACSEPSSPNGGGPRLGTAAYTSLVPCETQAAVTERATIGAAGGTIVVGGATISIPPDAVLGPTEFTVTIPATNARRVDIAATGFEHFIFEQPITVSLDYLRCSPGRIDSAPLAVWYVDNAGTLLERMPTLDDRNRRRVTFLTGHLSGYAIAN